MINAVIMHLKCNRIYLGTFKPKIIIKSSDITANLCIFLFNKMPAYLHTIT